MPICKSCGEDKEKHARGLCAQCYWVEYQREVRRKEKLKVGKPPKPIQITPRKIMYMSPEYIVANWDKICKAVGL